MCSIKVSCLLGYNNNADAMPWMEIYVIKQNKISNIIILQNIVYLWLMHGMTSDNIMY